MSSFKFSDKRYGLLLLVVGFLFAVHLVNSSSSVHAVTWHFQPASSYIKDHHRRSKETTVVAHAPGFTLFENAYWKNHTWYFVSSRPWAFPELPMIMTDAPDYNERASFHDGLAKLVSLAEAELLGLDFNDVEVVEGSTVSALGDAEIHKR
jgi:hypothetical protein